MTSERILRERMHDLEVMLSLNMQRKRTLESEIDHQFEELKQIETSLEISQKENTAKRIAQANVTP